MTTGRNADLTKTIMNNVREARARLKMSAQDLADRCEQLEVPMGRSTIANLENGRREYITISELLAFAYALNTPALLLVFPGASVEDSRARARFIGWDQASQSARAQVNGATSILKKALKELEKYQ